MVLATIYKHFLSLKLHLFKKKQKNMRKCFKNEIGILHSFRELKQNGSFFQVDSKEKLSLASRHVKTKIIEKINNIQTIICTRNKLLFIYDKI